MEIMPILFSQHPWISLAVIFYAASIISIIYCYKTAKDEDDNYPN